MIEALKDLRYLILIFKKDSCKKCLVRACCTQICEEKQDLKFFLGGENIIVKRIIAIVVWISFLYLPTLAWLIWK